MEWRGRQAGGFRLGASCHDATKLTPIQKIDHSSGRTGLCDCIVYIHEKKCVLAHVVVVVVAKFKAACCEFRAAGDRDAFQ